MTTTYALIWAKFILALVVMFIMYKQRCKDKHALLSVPILAWMMHTAIYSVAYIIDHAGGYSTQHIPFFMDWAGAIQLQAYITILISEAARWARMRRVTHGC